VLTGAAIIDTYTYIVECDLFFLFHSCTAHKP